MKSFILNGKQIQVKSVLEDALQLKDFSSFEIDALNVIRDWLTGKEKFSISTSGSTGKSKDITFHRKQIELSAMRTIKAFSLWPGDTMLACLHPKHVAGFMMLVRAMVGDLNLIIQTPSSNPLSNIDLGQRIDFLALTPYQVENAWKNSADKFDQISKVLIGGAGLDHELEEVLQQTKAQIFHSYAMTETLTHVALRQVNGKGRASFFRALEGVSFSIDDRSCLVVDDKLLGIRNLITKDIVDLKSSGTMIWKGRADNVINSGGIKINIDELEVSLKKVFSQRGIENQYCLVGKPDKILGERMILLVEGKMRVLSNENLLLLLRDTLPKYHSPKMIVSVPEIIKTTNGKIDRIKNAEVYFAKK